MAHDHEHSHLSETELRVRALETVLLEKGYIDRRRQDDESLSSLVGRLQIRLPCINRYLKSLVGFRAPEFVCIKPHCVKPLRILPSSERIRVREDMAAT